MKTYCRQEISRGDIYYADLRPVIGSEQGGIRPVLILQNNVGNRHSPTVIAAPITSKMGKPRLPTHVCLNTRWLTSLMPRKRVRSWTRWASTAEKNTGNLCWSLRQRWNRRSQRWKRRRCDRPDNALLARCAPLWGVLPPSWHPYPSTGLKRRVRALCRCADRDSSQP